METNEIIKIWKENNIESCVMEFSCGGDSMNDTNFTLYDKDGKEVDNSEITDYFDSEVYNNVEFYEVSDGHYMGESGNVTITFEEDEDEEDGGTFSYDKDATSEWEETIVEDFKFNLTEEEIKFVKEKVSNMNGGDWGEPNVNYKIDCIVTDEEEELVENLMKRIVDECRDYEFEESPGEQQDEIQWTTNEDGNEIEWIDNSIAISVTGRFFVTKPSND